MVEKMIWRPAQEEALRVMRRQVNIVQGSRERRTLVSAGTDDAQGCFGHKHQDMPREGDCMSDMKA